MPLADLTPIRVLLIDGPCRGWDVPYMGGGRIQIPAPVAEHDVWPPKEVVPPVRVLTYRIDPIRTARGEKVLLGSLTDGDDRDAR